MTNEQLINVVFEIASLFEAMTYEASRAKEDIPISNEDVQISHIVWMCKEIPNLIQLGKFGKAHRWLGFIQGVLWSQKWYSLDKLKEMNRDSTTG